ncbi:YfcE family phosphodiesterase [Weissella halotolerans]|nr:YfcE family phosphodiesterase [Weissella halotolerans]
MTQYVVVSDAHGDAAILNRIRQAYQGRVDQLFYLGDAELKSTDPSLQAYQVVAGNMDTDPAFPKERVYQDPTARLYLSHGHLYHSQRDPLALLLAGKEQHADIILTGHTHRLGVELVDCCLMLNPGSIALPRGPYANIGGIYAILTVTANTFGVAFYNRQLEKVPTLSVQIARPKN